MSIEIACLLCDDVRREVSRKHTLVGVYSDTIIFRRQDWEKNGNLARLGKLCFATFVSGVEGEHGIELWLEDPDGEPFQTAERAKAMHEFASGPSSTVIVELGPFVFKKLGTYSFHMQIEELIHYSKKFEVRLADQLVEDRAATAD